MKEIVINLMLIFNEQIDKGITIGTSFVNLNKVFTETGKVITNDNTIKNREQIKDFYERFKNCFYSYKANKKDYMELTEAIYAFQITCNECFGHYLNKV